MSRSRSPLVPWAALMAAIAVAPGIVRAELGGPVVNANDGQPAGALSGVVVFCSGGHGWTASSSGWGLQRPLLLDMNEDYGNIDQLNYFAAYLFNAGATVVPFRPVGYQNVEIVLDNDDPGVTFSGPWSDSTANAEYYENGATGGSVPYRYAFTADAPAVARYTPDIPVADFYPVYCWTRGAGDRVRQTYRIRHSGGTAEVVIDHTRVGQGWIWLGDYYFDAGAGGYVEISNDSPDNGVVIADAIRFGIGMGDMKSYGTGQPSGFPRNEEAARYWAESEAGFNAVGLPSSIWDCCSSDTSDNVATGTRWARYMNLTSSNNQRWRRVYLEFHTNAANTTAKGTVALIHSTDPTINQTRYAQIMGDKIESEMVAVQDRIEHTWGLRGPTYSGQYGAISGYNTGDEFDATILEVAFHDTPDDAENLRNVKVRDAVAQAAVHGLIDFLSDTSIFPDTQVQRIYAPNRPEDVSVASIGNGQVRVRWSPPTTPPAADSPTGYKVYRSFNGYGFGNATVVADAQARSVVLDDLLPGVTTYLRVAAYNAGGESMPSEVLAVRMPDAGPAELLIVNGFDRIDRKQNPTTYLPGRGPTQRQTWRAINSFDYTVQHAEALAPLGYTFDCCSNEAVIRGEVPLEDYGAVVWILGEEMSNSIPSSAETPTLTSGEQSLLSTYLSGGGGLFISGSEIAWDLDHLAVGRDFCRTLLAAEFFGDDAQTYGVAGTGPLSDIAPFSFAPADGAPYDADWPDQITPTDPYAEAVLAYNGGSGGTAAIRHDGAYYRTVVLGLPFETIASPAARTDVMQRSIEFLLTTGLARVDFDRDGDVDMSDFGHLQACYSGHGVRQEDPLCFNARLDEDSDVDPFDYALFMQCFSGPGIQADPACMQ